MTISVDVGHRLGAFELQARFEAAGRLTALFGRSGSGKTSLVGIVAGLVRPDRGRVAIDDRVLVDTEARIMVPRHRRRIGYVFQDARLFPHLSVRNNLLFGRLFAPRTERRVELAGVVDLLGIGHLLDRRPGALSGGEKSRVAIGRALLSAPRLVLMDEPLAALDDDRKTEILPYLERLRDEAAIPIIYVSHSVAEVARLADTVVVLEAGRVAATGFAAEVLRRPDLPDAIGGNELGALVEASIVSHDEAFGLTLLASTAGILTVTRLPRPLGARLRLRIRARDVILARERPAGTSALNALAGRVETVTESGPSAATVAVDCSGVTVLARITRRSVHDLGLAPGIPVHAVIKTVAFDPDGFGALAEEAM